MAKFAFWGTRTTGAYNASGDPLAVFKGHTSKGRKGKGRNRKGWKGRGGGGRDLAHPKSSVCHPLCAM